MAAPSKLQRPAGDRVKTDARDAAHLARLLHLGQIVEVAMPERSSKKLPAIGARPRRLPAGSAGGAPAGIETASATWDHLLRREGMDR